MPAPEPNLEALTYRVVRLEAQNRWLKRVIIPAVLIAVVMITMGQTKRENLGNADNIVVGKIQADAIVIQPKGKGPATFLEPGSMRVFGDTGYVEIEGNAILMSEKGKKDPSTWLLPGDMQVQGDSGSVEIKGSEEEGLSTEEGPAVRVRDKQGFESVLGVSNVVTIKTGTESRSSAASINMFGKDNKVIWSAP